VGNPREKPTFVDEDMQNGELLIWAKSIPGQGFG
jgi:hypothetical protein